MRVLVATASIALFGLTAGCGTAADNSDTTASPPLREVPPPLVAAVDLPPAAVDNAVAKLDGIAEDLLKSSGVPGMAVAVVHGGKAVYARGFGVKDVRNGDGPENKVDSGTVFQLASLSKSLASTVIAHQVSDHAIEWDTPLVSKLPWFALSDPVVTKMVSVGDMFSHRSGLPDHAGDRLEDLGYDRRYILDRLRQLPLDPFRISYAYTNFGVTAAAEAVAVSAGKRWEDLSNEVLYAPLGMTSTSSRFADYQARPDKAIGHIFVDNSYQPLYQRDADQEAPAGGASSSVDDMTHWLTMMLDDGKYQGSKIIDAQALLPAISPQIVSNPPTEAAMRAGFYGFGFNVSTTSAARTQLSHSGAFELGAGANFMIIPSADVAIVALTNATPSGIPESLTAEFADLVQFGKVREDWRGLYKRAFAQMGAPEGSVVGKTAPPEPAPPAALQSYVGAYANNFWGTARVALTAGKLSLSLGPRGVAWPLTHWDGNVFTFSFVSENSPPGSISTATFNGDKLTLEYFDDDGKGTFTR